MSNRLLLNPKSPVVVDPADGSGARYTLRVPLVGDRAAYRHALRTAGARRWSEVDLLDALADGVRAILSEPGDEADREERLEIIAAHRARLIEVAEEVRNAGPMPAVAPPAKAEGEEGAEGAGAEADDDDDATAGPHAALLRRMVEALTPSAELRAIEEVVLRFYPPYAARVADREVYADKAAAVAAAMFLTGWEGLREPFRRDRFSREIPAELLAQVPSPHLRLIGAEVERLIEPPPARLGN